MLQQISGPKALPLVGHLPWILRSPLAFFTRLAREHGDVARFRIGPHDLVFLNHPSLIDQLVRTREAHRSPPTRDALRSFLGDGLLSLEDAAHLRHRRLMAPAFHRERIRTYSELMIRETYRATERWLAGGVVDLRKAMMELTFNIVAGALFSQEATQEMRIVDEAMRVISPAVVRYAQLMRLVGRPFPAPFGPKTRRGITNLKGMVEQLVARRRREGGDRGDLLSMLIAARDEDGSSLADADVASEALTILLAGHETTSITLTWAFALLHSHPQIARKLAEEVREVAGERELRHEDLPRLVCSERVVKETLRLYPAAWWGDRVPAEGMSFGDHYVPADTTVVFSVYVTQRDGRFFPLPEQFDPERFLPERVGEMNSAAWLPFGAGVHMCIGNVFALTEARVILSVMAQRLVVVPESAPRMQEKPNVGLEMAHPFPVRFVPSAASRLSSDAQAPGY